MDIQKIFSCSTNTQKYKHENGFEPEKIMREIYTYIIFVYGKSSVQNVIPMSWKNHDKYLAEIGNL